MASALERAARAIQDEIERQVADTGYLGWGSGQEERRPSLGKTYVDGDLDASALARAVLMAVIPTLKRYDSDQAGLYEDEKGDYVLFADLDAILNEKDTTND